MLSRSLYRLKNIKRNRFPSDTNINNIKRTDNINYSKMLFNTEYLKLELPKKITLGQKKELPKKITLGQKDKLSNKNWNEACNEYEYACVMRSRMSKA